MNIKTVTAMSAILIAAIASVPLHAQDAGFRIGTPQPQNPLATPGNPNPVQGMTSPPIQGMTTPPIMPMGGGFSNQTQNTIVVPQVHMGIAGNSVTVLPPGGIVFVPAGTLIIENSPGMQPGVFLNAPPLTVVPAAPAAPGGRGGGTSIQRPARTGTTPTQEPVKPDVTRLELGTPRDKVIEKYGNPVAFIMNMNGETLYFSGGVVVFVRNGVVATPVN